MAITRLARASSDVPEKKVRVSRVEKKKVLLKAKKTPGSVAKVTLSQKIRKTPIPRKRTAHILVSEEQSVAVSIPVSRSTGTTLAFPKIVSIAQLSPFRFPVDQQKVLAQTSRLSGLAVVFLGAILTLFNMFGYGTLFPSSETFLKSEVISSTANCTSTTSPNYSIELCGSNGSIPGTINTKPDVSFTVDQKNPLSEVVPIYITVRDASYVEVYARNKSTGSLYPLGSAVRTSDSVWRIAWSTHEYEDGTYTIKASVTNRYTAYTATASGEYTVENHPVTTIEDPIQSVTQTTASTTISTNTVTHATSGQSGTEDTVVTTEETTLTPAISFSLDSKEPLTGTALFTVNASRVADVKVYVQNETDEQKQFLGYAVYNGNDVWKYYWNTRAFKNDKYTVYAHMRTTSGVAATKVIHGVAVHNSTEGVAVTATTSTPVQNATEDAHSLESLGSTIKINVPEKSNFTGVRNVLFTVSDARFIEVYAVPKGSLVKKFLGLARKLSDTEWVLAVDTTQIPNGDYALFGLVRFLYGEVESSRESVTVKNSTIPVYTDEQVSYLESLNTLKNEIEIDAPMIKHIVPAETQNDVVTDNSTGDPTDNIEGVVPTTQSIEPIAVSHFDETAKASVVDFETTLRSVMQQYAEALRVDDTSRIETLRSEIEVLKKDLTDDIRTQGRSADEIDRMQAQVDDVVKVSEARVVHQEKIIKERIGGAVHTDSDSDGISDYDEVALYKTNPYRADTDKDGFIDSVEILKGFDPTQSVQESLVAYESPKDTGVVRADVLTVHTVATIDESDGDLDVVQKPKALISGRGLPNSFVTLYIFSTPVIVTVKTDADGSWSYIFDKELEDGAHEVYVGMTDNAGRVVAKSEAFSFVKTAEAFSPVSTGTESIVEAAVAEPSFVTQQALLVIASIAVVALGLILILLGMHVDLWYTRKLVPQ